jgi:hypothetical protein
MSRMSDAHPTLVVFHTARTPFEASVIAGVLQDAGIPCFVAGTALNDEWAASQRLMNTLGVDIQVRESDREAALRALAAAKESGKLLEGEAET